MKYIKPIALLLSLILVLTSGTFSAAAKEESGEELTFRQSITLVKGSSDYISVSHADADTRITYTSSDKKIASVSKKGEVTAKKCGIATITARAVKGDYAVTSEIKVSVVISKYRIKKQYGKPTKRVGSTDKLPRIVAAGNLKKGSTLKFTVSGTQSGDRITYHSNNEERATVDENGKIKALKKGKVTVTATVKRDGVTYTAAQKLTVVNDVYKGSISAKQRNAFYGDSAFIGSSIGVGQKNYFNSRGKGFLGNPVMLVRGCYSFANDRGSNGKYQVQYKGVSMKARYAVKKAGVKRVFINMGTNDLFRGVTASYHDYVDFIKGIQKESPGIVIFIESMTGVHARKQGSKLNSKNVKEFNRLMREYCKGHKDVYYVDVGSRLLDGNGHLSSTYSSDNYVHLTYPAYAIWTEELTAYTDALAVAERNAQDAVKTAEKSKAKEHIRYAKKLVKALEKSSVKSELKKRIEALEND